MNEENITEFIAEVTENNTESLENNYDEEILKQLTEINEKIDNLYDTEEVTEDVTEEITEDIDPSLLPLTNGEYQEGVTLTNENLIQIKESLEYLNEQLEVLTVEDTEDITEEVTEEVTEHTLIYSSGTVADGTLYFSDKVENADINDLYSMVWSVRNTILIFLFIFVFVLLYKAFKHLIYKFTNL